MTFADLDAIVAEKSLLKHPFYVRWTKGELTKDELRVYAKEYFHLVERIPGIVARVRDRATDDVTKANIEQNMVEEQEHVELWKRFAKSLDISSEELVSHEPSQAVRDAVNDLEALADGDFQQGLVAMYALEAELPEIARTKMAGLDQFYGLTSEDAQIYFEEHLKEEKHLAVWRSQPIDENARQIAALSVAAQNRVLDGVCKEAGIELMC